MIGLGGMVTAMDERMMEVVVRHALQAREEAQRRAVQESARAGELALKVARAESLERAAKEARGVAERAERDKAVQEAKIRASYEALLGNDKEGDALAEAERQLEAQQAELQELQAKQTALADDLKARFWSTVKSELYDQTRARREG
ncbi:unnamed protein product [Closterium sp. Yama58-4]|nr:unnamed protein product [Closterium sp. Yama58-4]